MGPGRGIHIRCCGPSEENHISYLSRLIVASRDKDAGMSGPIIVQKPQALQTRAVDFTGLRRQVSPTLSAY